MKPFPISSRRGASHLLAAAVLAAGAGGAAPALAQLECDPCGIGVVFDGPWEGNEALRTRVEHEVAALAAPRFRVVFPTAAQRVADWTPAAVREALDALLRNPEVHVVLTYGPVGSGAAAARGDRPKPVVAAFVIDPEAQGFPVTTNAAGERVSGVPNLAYLTFTRDPAEEIRRLREVAPFTRLTYLASEALLLANPSMEETLGRGVREAGGEAVITRVGASVAAALAALPPDTEAVYVTPLPQLSAAGFAELTAGLIARRLPSFSYLGREEVDRGLLASLYLETDLERLGRRIALHIQRILLGEDAGDLPVDFRRRRRLTLNLATARAIGVHPGWRVLTDAELLHDTPLGESRRLSLAAAVRESLAANLDLRAADRVTAAGLAAVRAARAPLLPQVTASGSYDRIDSDRSAASFGIQNEWTAAGSVGLSQLLFSDRARAGAAVERYAQSAREADREAERLDVAHGAATAYLNVLRARTFARIQRENLALTRANLEIAEARREIGVARATEVVRWENQVANHRRAVIEADAALAVARIALNRLRNRPLEEPVETADLGLDDPELLASAAIVEGPIQNPAAFAILRDFLSAEALAASPELARLDAAIAAGERTLLAARRAFWAPTLAADGRITALRVPDRAGAFDLFPDALQIAPANAINWSLGVSAALPVFAGGARFAEARRARESLAELRLRRAAAAERVETALRSALHYAAASYWGIGLAEEAADAARRNLTLVTGAYEQGALSILDLIDAQNTALVAEESAATAVYDYFLDLMDANRASGRIEAFLDPPDPVAFAERMRAFFAEAGYEPPQPR